MLVIVRKKLEEQPSLRAGTFRLVIRDVTFSKNALIFWHLLRCSNTLESTWLCEAGFIYCVCLRNAKDYACVADGEPGTQGSYNVFRSHCA